MFRQTSIFATALLIASPAWASGIVTPPAAPVIVPVDETWTGAYVGLQGETIISSSIVAGTIEFEADALLFGVFGGYRYDLGDIVVGAEVDYVVGSGEFTVTSPSGLQLIDPDRDFTIFRAGLETGYDLGDVLAYGTAGFASIQIESSSTSVDGSGYFAGVGLDYRVSESITVGAELLYHDFGEVSGGRISQETELTTLGLNLAFTF